MPTPRNTPSIREPFSEDVSLTVGGVYYDAAAQAQILSSFRRKPKADERGFLRRVETAASIYVDLAAMTHRADLPSNQRRKWDALAGCNAKLMAALDTLSPDERDSLRSAAADIARHEGLPGFEPEHVDVTMLGTSGTKLPQIEIWPVERKLSAVRRDLEWLSQVINEAKERVARYEGRRKGGNRTDEPQHEFFRYLWLQYNKVALAPGAPYRSEHALGGAEGEFIAVARACLLPLGVKLSRLAILGTFERAINPPRTDRRRVTGR